MENVPPSGSTANAGDWHAPMQAVKTQRNNALLDLAFEGNDLGSDDAGNVMAQAPYAARHRAEAAYHADMTAHSDANGGALPRPSVSWHAGNSTATYQQQQQQHQHHEYHQHTAVAQDAALGFDVGTDELTLMEATEPELFQAGVLEHARVLGIDPESEPEFLWLARESLIAAVPDGWYHVTASTSGQPYYYNEVTGESRWDHPSDDKYRQLYRMLKQKQLHQGKAAMSMSMYVPSTSGHQQYGFRDSAPAAHYYDSHATPAYQSYAWEDHRSAQAHGTNGYDANAEATYAQYHQQPTAAWDNTVSDDQYAADPAASAQYSTHTNVSGVCLWCACVGYANNQIPKGYTSTDEHSDWESDSGIRSRATRYSDASVTRATSAASAVEDQRAAEIEQLGQQLKDRDAEIEQIKLHASETEQHLEASRQAMKDLQEKFDHSVIENQRASGEAQDISSLQAKLEELERQNATFSEQLEARANVQTDLLAVLDEKKEMTERLAALNAAVAELDAIAAERDTLKAQLEEVEQRLSADQSNSEHTDSLEKSVQDLQQQLNQLTEELKETRSNVDTIMVERDELKQQLEATTQAAAAHQENSAVVETLTQELTSTRAQLDDLTALLQKTKSEKSSLVARLKKSEQAAATTTGQTEEQQRLIESLSREIEEIRQQLHDAQLQLESSEKNRLELTSLMEASNSASASQQEEAKELQRENTKLYRQLEALREEVKASQTHQAALTDEKNALVAKLAETEQSSAASLGEAEEQNRTFKREIRSLERELKTLQVVAKERDEELVAAKTQVEALETKLVLQEQALEQAAKAAYEEARQASAETIKQIQAEKARMADLYTQELQTRRKLHNKMMEMQGNIRVFCRVRPIQPVELKTDHAAMAVFFRENDRESLELHVGGGDATADGKGATLAIQKHTFEFDHVFQPSSTQFDVFEQTKALVISALDGFNVCIFAYGQTGSGKTHTMEGSENDRGVNYRALQELFRIRDDRIASGNFECSMKLSILEVYNETIVDLLDSGQDRKPLDVRMGKQGTYVENLIEVEVFGEKDVTDLMKLGHSHRSIGSHDFNEHSSRSHLVLSISIETFQKVDNRRLASKLHLIDLAGSERVSKTAATGQRLKEAQNINRSLSALGDVIAALGANSKHVPYRNSKLTFLLQESLSGNSKVLMFVNISPVQWNAWETLCSLNFASRCRNIALGQAKANVSGGSGGPPTIMTASNGIGSANGSSGGLHTSMSMSSMSMNSSGNLSVSASKMTGASANVSIVRASAASTSKSSQRAHANP
ncbi:TPA: hypothetical protein N0F65_008786 [Lagenidium giganteum]|uniref:Kinesin-like protein n=1 Tax=Lagenidium giganteum TaxID=4803 RepID=A0AAV2YUT8_9STRA|nr:TPA: hypothetical protein N0F65_008786 [Lagenidium giganteum]